MSRFVTPLRLERLEDTSSDGRGTWKVLTPLVYRSDLATYVVVPAGFVTDLASVPRVPFAYMLTGGIGHAAAVVHDFLYCCHIVPRKVADSVFHEALLVLGVPRWRAWLMFIGVRIGGAGPWDAAWQRQPEVVASLIQTLSMEKQ